jgi:Transposase
MWEEPAYTWGKPRAKPSHGHPRQASGLSRAVPGCNRRQAFTAQPHPLGNPLATGGGSDGLRTTFLDGWVRRAEASGIKILQQMTKTLAAHRTGLLGYYDVMISSGPMEGTNNKIKTMKRQAYGFRDMEFFKLKILAIHETRYELVG